MSEPPKKTAPLRRPPSESTKPRKLAESRFIVNPKAKFRGDERASARGGQATRSKKQKISLVKVTAGEFFTSKPRDKK